MSVITLCSKLVHNIDLCKYCHLSLSLIVIPIHYLYPVIHHLCRRFPHQNGNNFKGQIILFYNQFHKILRLLDALPIFLFTTSETMGDYYVLCINMVYTYILPHELPNDLRLRILANQEISGKCVNFIEW